MIAPGIVKTHFSEALWKDPKQHDKVVRQVPLGRFGESDDIAGAAAFLASSDSSYVWTTAPERPTLAHEPARALTRAHGYCAGHWRDAHGVRGHACVQALSASLERDGPLSRPFSSGDTFCTRHRTNHIPPCAGQ